LGGELSFGFDNPLRVCLSDPPREMPRRPPKRVQFATSFSRETKARIEQMARDTGQSQRQICEHLIETALLFRGLAENVNATFYRLGYTPLRTAHGLVWYPPGHPEAPKRGGFEAWQPGELEALGIEAVDLPPLEPLPDRKSEVTVELEARIAKLEALVQTRRKP
jgi:hypothetical protein